MFNRIAQMFRNCDTENSVLPPTELYNEGWMLRVTLNWFSKKPRKHFPLSFIKGSRWYSEVLLPSQFRPQYRGDPLSETHTHADGAIGNFTIGLSGKGDLNLSPDAKQLVVVEAKMFSKFSREVKNSKNFDQVARTVSCIAEILRTKDTSPDKISHLGFYVLAPSEQIENVPTFKQYTSKEVIRKKVYDRVMAYNGREDKESKLDWLYKWFVPTIEQIYIACISWEDIISYIQTNDIVYGEELNNFYLKCLDYNRPMMK